MDSTLGRCVWDLLLRLISDGAGSAQYRTRVY